MFFQIPIVGYRFVLGFVLLLHFGGVGQDTLDFIPTVELSGFSVIEVESENSLTNYYKGNGMNLTENVMERLPSVSLIKRGNFAPEPVFRGFSAGQINLTIDGMHIFGACTDRMDPVSSYVESNNLKEIQAGCDVNSCSNGAGLGGVINMEMAQPDLANKGFTGFVSTGYQTISNAFSSAMNLGYSNKYFGLRVSGAYRTSDNYKDPDGNEVPFTQYNKTNFSANLVSNYSKYNRFKFDYIYDYAWDVGYAALPMDVGLAKANIYSFTYERFFFSNKLQKLELKLYGNNIYHEMDDTKRPDVPMHMDMPGKSDTYGGYFTLNWNNLNNHIITAKADAFVNYSIAEMTMYPYESAPMFMLTWPDVRRIVAGVYGSDRWEINEKIILSGSVRFDRGISELQSEFGKDHLRIFGYDVDDPFKQNIWNIIIEPEYRINDKFTLNLTAALKQRLPTISEQFGFYLYNAYDGYDYIGNPYLKSESALQSDLSLSYKSKALNLQITGFYYAISNYIVGEIDPDLSTMTIGANGVKVYTSIDRANMYGFEASGIWTKKAFTWVNILGYSFGKDEYGEVLPQLPPFKFTSTLTYERKKWAITPELIAAAARNNVRQSFGETPNSGWVIFNLRAYYQIKKKTTWKLEFGIENITNNYYSEFLDWGHIPRPGRNFYVNLSFRF